MGKIYLDCRDSLGFVTDPANAVGVSGSDIYPVTRGGVTFGYTVGSGGPGTALSTAVDRSAANIAQLAGIHYRANNLTPVQFQVDLAALGGAGQYKIGLALGDQAFAEPEQHIVVKDGATTLFSLDDAAGPGVNSFLDANDVELAEAAWLAGQTFQTGTVAGSSVTFIFGQGGAASGQTTVACIYLEFVPAGGGLLVPRSLRGGFFN